MEHLSSSRDTLVPLISNTEQDNLSDNSNVRSQALGCENLKFSNLGPSYRSLHPDHSEGAECTKFDDHGTESRGLLSDMTVKNVGDLSNDFANTFMLDEEIELEQKTIKKDDSFSSRRYQTRLFLFDLL